MKHTNGPNCERCNAMLPGGHPVLQKWGHWLRERRHDAHFFTVWRGKEDQDRAILEKKSFKKWPLSEHNKTAEDGTPRSEAFDVFRLSEDGKAEFPNLWYLQIAEDFEQAGAPLDWGGDWVKLKDLVHFQLKKGVA